MYVIRNDSAILMYNNLENAKNKLLEILNLDSGSIEFVMTNIGLMKDRGTIFELSIKNNKTVNTKDLYSAFNDDPIMYNGPGGYFPDELRFLEPEDEEDENC